MGRSGLVAARVVAVAGALFWGWLFYGVQDTLTVFVEGADFATHYLTESGWGLLFLVLVAVPLVGIARRPRSPVLVAQVAVVGVAVLVAALLAGSARHALPGLGLLLTALLVSRPARADGRPRRPHGDLPLLACALVAAPPAVVYAWRTARSTVDPERTWGLDHYPVQAALALALVLVLVVVAWDTGATGARLSLVAVGVTAAWMGVESVVYPDLVGSFGRTGGWLAAGWAAATLVVGLRRGARAGAPLDEPPSADPRRRRR